MTGQLINTEQDLIRRFKAGEKEAFSAVYKQYYYKIYLYAKYWLAEKKDAEDATSETFFQLFKRHAQFVNLENIWAFLKITVKNRCFDQLRREKVRQEKKEELVRQLASEEEPDLTWAEAKELLLQQVYSHVDQLPPKMREIFLLAFRDGLKNAEIAEKLQITVRTVSNQKTSALNLLKSALSQRPLLLAFLLLLET